MAPFSSFLKSMAGCESARSSSATSPRKVPKRRGTAPLSHPDRCPETMERSQLPPLPNTARHPSKESGGLEVPSSNLGAPSAKAPLRRVSHSATRGGATVSRSRPRCSGRRAEARGECRWAWCGGRTSRCAGPSSCGAYSPRFARLVLAVMGVTPRGRAWRPTRRRGGRP
jgi:hypothetical protein